MDLKILEQLPLAPATEQSNLTAAHLTGNTQNLSELYGGVSQGERNQSAARVTGKLIEAKMTKDDALKLMRGWNQQNCPPMDDVELVQTVDSIFSTHKRNQLAKEFDPETGELPAIEFLSCEQMLEYQCQSNWLIKDLMDQQTLNLVIGEPGSMKSIFGIDIGLHVATGTSWHGYPVKQTGPVFYICGEGFMGVSRRLKAWKIKQYGHERGPPIPFYTSRGSVDISDPEAVAQLETIIRALSTEYGDPALLIVDTLNRNFGPGDENSTADMTRFINGLDRVRQNLNTTMLVVHHTGLSNRQRSRGSSALKAAVDAEFLLEVVR